MAAPMDKFRMATGDGENSYAANSRIQAKAILENRAALQEAVEEIYRSLSAGKKKTMVVADLGCSSGPNTLLVVSEVVAAVRAAYHRNKDTAEAVVEVQFFLNDPPGNDFNLVFRSLGKLKAAVSPAMPRCYVAGLPGSFYERLFPSQSVHFFHSSNSLHWRSKVEKLNSFNLPFYAPSVGEVEALISSTKLFDIEHMRVFETDWDPMNDSEGDTVALADCAIVGSNVAKVIRAVTESLIVDHFSDYVLDELFMAFSSAVAKHVEKANAKCPVIIVSLKKAATQC